MPGAVTLCPVVERPDADLAASIVWFDAFVTNVERTARNTNMLMWHRRLWLIDHGAALYVHHDGDTYLERSRDPFPLIRDHVLLRAAGSLEAAAARMRAALPAPIVHEIVARIPGEWLAGESAWSDPAQHRAAYAEYLLGRLESADLFLAEALRARSLHL